jgi:hypothetical protein
VSHSTRAQRSKLSLILIFSMIIAACSPGMPVIPVPSQTAAVPVETALAPETPPSTAQPSLTPAPLPRQVFLLAPPDSDPRLLEEVQPVLQEMAHKSGYEFEVLSSLSPEQITPDVRMVVSLPPDPGLQALAASASETDFFAIGIPGLEESANLTSTAFRQGEAGWQGFMGGIIAALITPDWRVGTISIADTSDGLEARNGFLNGVIYICGTCRQIYPPFFDSQSQLIQYPLYVELPAGAENSAWLAAADILIERGVETIFLHPGAGGEGLLSYLAESGIKIIGGIAPPENIQINWVASIYSDSSSTWASQLEKALKGQELAQGSGDLQIEYINTELLSPGRQKHAEAVLQDLLAGYIEPGFIEESVNEP